MINYLVRLGWSYGDQEVFSLQELIEKFSFENVQKSSAVFNPNKLLWMNAHYIRHNDPQRVAALLQPFLEQAGLGKEAKSMPAGWMEKLVIALRERAQTLVELAAAAIPYVQQDVIMDEAAAKKYLTPAIAAALELLVTRIEALPGFTKAVLEEAFKEVLAAHGLKMGELAQPVRVALTGRTASPGIFDVLDLLGRERAIARLQHAIRLARGSR
jgi:glutamyl-tRNA synthetase